MIYLDENAKVLEREIRSRGIPSKFAFYLPPHYSKEIKKFEENEMPTRNLWTLDEVVNFLFPKQYQPTYHNIAVSFLNYLIEKQTLYGKEIAEFVKTNNISKATFYNKVLPKLKRAGMVKVERETVINEEKKRKFRPMRISLSKTFGNYLNKIADSWLAIVDDARSRR